MVQAIVALLTKKFEEDEAFQNCYIVEVKYKEASQKLEVFVDTDSGISIDQCAHLNRYLQAILDEELWLGEAYTLEVSSPGVEHPLRFERQYRKNIGRKLKVTLTNGSEHEGKLTAVSETGIELTHKTVLLEGKRKKVIDTVLPIPFADISKAIVQISFS